MAVMTVAAYLHDVRMPSIILVIVSAHAALEMIAEAHSHTEYYEGVSIMPMVIFWIFAGGLTISGWLIIIVF